jgi:translocation and assembly module TamA
VANLQEGTGSPRRRGARACGIAILCLASILVGAGCASRHASNRPVVRGLHISGNHALSSRDIEKQIATRSTGWWPLATKRYFDDAIWDADLRRIVRFYESRGYYQAHIVRSNVTPRPHNDVALDVEIDEGQPTRVSAIDIAGIDGLPEADRRAALEKPAVTRGQPFTEHGWASLKSRLHDRLRDRGYAEVAVDGKALVDVETRQAALDVSVRPGQRYRFGELQIDTGGGKAISPDWIRAEARLAIAPDGIFSNDALVEAQRRLIGMGVLGAVRVEPGTPDPATLRVPVKVTTSEAPLHTLGFGGGLRIDQIRTEGRLIAEWSNRNFRGGMRRLTLHIEAGWAFLPGFYDFIRSSEPTRNGPIARARGEFEQPRLFGHASLRELTQLELEHTLEQTYDATAARLGNGIVWKPRSALEIHPSYHIEVDRLTGPPGAGVLVAPLTLGCTTTTQSCVVWLSYLEEAVVWDRRNNPLEPRHGYYASLSLQQGGGPLGGNFTYLRFLPELRGYFTVGQDDDGSGGFTLASRVRFGQLMPSSGNPDDSAVVTRFYSGGAFSMRGFNEQRLSPLLLTSQPPTAANPRPPLFTLPIGGDGLFEGSVEARYAITEHLILALFMDVGQVTRGTFDASNFAHMMFAVGVGLRYRTPIGPIRIDFARRLPFGTPPELFAVEPTTGRIVQLPYAVDDSCFGIGGSNVSRVVPDNLCVLHIAIGEAF